MNKILKVFLSVSLTVSFFVILAHTAFCQVPSDALNNIAKIKAELILQRQEVLKEISSLQAHLDKVRSFSSTLNQDKDKEAILVSQQAIEKDRVAIDKVNARIKELNTRLGLAERADKYLKNDAGKNMDLAVLEIKGDVRVTRKGVAQAVKLTQDSQIRAGDEIKTGKDSIVVLTTIDGSSVELRENSTFFVEENSLDSCLTNLNIGVMKAKVERILMRRYIVRTPTVAVAVRGTEFEVEVDSKGLTQVRVIEGNVEVQKNITLKQGQTWSEGD